MMGGMSITKPKSVIHRPHYKDGECVLCVLSKPKKKDSEFDCMMGSVAHHMPKREKERL
jgi:hypothetical protein